MRRALSPDPGPGLDLGLSLILRRRLSSAALALAGALLPCGGGAKADAAYIRADLQAETSRPAAGSTITLALSMTPAPGWHGYWQNPGDAGAPAHIAWTLPRGAAVGPLRYPVPKRLMTQTLMNYVYDRPYALLMTFTVPKGLAAGTPLRIAGRARWLACSATLCVPEQGPVAIDLVVGDGKVQPVVRARFDGWRARLPRPLGKSASFSSATGRISLSIPYPRSRPLTDPYFYSATDRAIDYAAPQLISRRGDRLIVELKAVKGAPAVSALDGVIATGGDRGFMLTARPR
jgi:DsbC/DsbD-like thiol-disulfide interchange protein